MKIQSLDYMTRSLLRQKGYPLHFYMQFLGYMADCLRELTFDTLRVVNTVQLTVSQQDFTAPLPCDYVDYTKVGTMMGQFVRPIPEIETINRLPAKLPNGQNTTYGNAGGVVVDDFPIWPGMWIWSNIDDLGENIGRMYGWPADYRTDGFKIIPERNIIQFTETFDMPTCVLEYISDGQTIDNASAVDARAQKTIETYCDWQWRWHTGKRSPAEIDMAYRMYVKEWKKLRARLSSLTISDIKQALHRNFKLSIKT